ncbi:MAG: hypothetical protein E6G67_03765 [Actinobacteria bacterium]|nr:MAG: hypothetical protein E6G67_03765 [Actinomycetota bacterium]
MEAGPVGGDRLQACEAAAARGPHLVTNSLAEGADVGALSQSLLRNPLDSQHGASVASRELAHPLPALPLARCRIAVVDEQDVCSRGAQQARRVVVGIGREAGWLAHVYGNVFFDVSLTIPHVARPAEMVREALELAPVSKLLYASDAARTPELYYLGARWSREGLAEVLEKALPATEAEEAGRRILRENALELYRLT